MSGACCVCLVMESVQPLSCQGPEEKAILEPALQAGNVELNKYAKTSKLRFAACKVAKKADGREFDIPFWQRQKLQEMERENSLFGTKDSVHTDPTGSVWSRV